MRNEILAYLCSLILMIAPVQGLGGKAGMGGKSGVGGGASSGGSAPAYVADTECSLSGTSVTCTATVSAATDHLNVVVGVNNTSGSAYTVAVSDPADGALTQDTNSPYFSAFNTQANSFYVFSTAASGSTVFTITSSTSTNLRIAIYESSGGTGAWDVVPTGSVNAGGSSTVTPNITTINAKDLVLAAMACSGGPGTTTVAGPYTLRATTSSADGANFADQTTSSAGAVTGATFTMTFGQVCFGITGALK